MLKTIYSITILVEDLDEAVKNYEALLGVKPRYSPGYEVLFTECGLREVGIDFKDQIAVFHLPGIRFILMTGFDVNAPIDRFIRDRGEGVLMISMEVENLEGEESRLRAHGKKFVLANDIEGDFGTINMLHPKDMNGVLFELIQTGQIFEGEKWPGNKKTMGKQYSKKNLIKIRQSSLNQRKENDDEKIDEF